MNVYGDCCNGCARRAVGCRTGCEEAAVHEIVKLLIYAEKQKKNQLYTDLSGRKQANIIRRMRRERKLKSR